MGRSLIVNPQVVKNIEESQSFTFKIPEDAAVKGTGDTATYSWMETLKVLDSSVGDDTSKPGCTVVTLACQVPPEQADSANVGRQLKLWYRYDENALMDAKHDHHKFSLINLARLKSIGRAAGWEMGDTDDWLEPFDVRGGAGEQAPIVGITIVAKFVDKPGKDQDGNRVDETGKTIRRQEPAVFFNPEQLNV